MTDLRIPPRAVVPSDRSQRVRAVQRRMATAVLPPLPPTELGDVRLMPHQRQAAAQLRRLLQRHGGALLADDVGLGKTFTALAVARHYARAHILAPAGLVAMWQAALLRAGLPHAAVHSLHRASRCPLPPFAVNNAGETSTSERPLIIVDEAHALRNAGTTRYRHVAGAVSGCDVLLLSATPLHNSPRDLSTLLALFRGPHATALPQQVLATLVVRRQQYQLDPSPEDGPRRTATPAVHVHRPFTVPQSRATLDRLLALPAPLPARDGAVAGALIRLGLLRAWCSSDVALTHALTKRLQRGTAMRDALQAGRHPSHTELASWVIGDDPAADMQLGFAELLSSHAVQPEEQHTALDLLGRHCDALRELRDCHVTHARADHARAAFLRTIRERHDGTPVVAFSQHARTVQALFRALSDIAGVGLLTGTHARIASGPVTRPELLGWFAPRAQGRPPPPPSLRVNLLLTTDLIAEGVNLQDAGVVVHLDLPWTHALHAQRTGRVVRLGSTHRLAHVYRLRAPRFVRRVVRIETTVARKAALAARLVGDRQAHAVVANRSAVVHASRWERRLIEWMGDDGGQAISQASAWRSGSVRSEQGVSGAIVLVRTTAAAVLLACVRQGARWWVSTRADALLALSSGELPARCAKYSATPACTGDDHDAWASPRAIRYLAQRWWRREQVRRLAGSAAIDSAVTGELNLVQREATAWLRRRVAELSPVRRAALAMVIQDAQTMIAHASSAGAAAALRVWMTGPPSEEEWTVPDWRVHPELCVPITSGISPAESQVATHAMVEACLWVRAS